MSVRRNEAGDGFVSEVTLSAGWRLAAHLVELEQDAGRYELVLDARSAFGTLDPMTTADVRAVAARLIELAEKAELWKGGQRA